MIQHKVSMSYPFFRVHVQLLDFAVVEECGEADSVVSEVRLFTENGDVVLAIPGIVLEDLLTVSAVNHFLFTVWIGNRIIYMKAMPTMPRPTTTSLGMVGIAFI